MRVGDHEGAPEGELVSPGCRACRILRGDDDEPGAGILDLGNGLRGTAKVGAADVSAGVPSEVHDGGMPEEVAVGDGSAVGVLQVEGR